MGRTHSSGGLLIAIVRVHVFELILGWCKWNEVTASLGHKTNNGTDLMTMPKKLTCNRILVPLNNLIVII